MRAHYCVTGRPATWQRTTSYQGRRITPKGQREAKRLIAWHALAARPPGWPLDESYELSVIGWWPDRRVGDVDRLVNLHLDALEGVMWKTDRQVRELSRCAVLLDRDRPRVEVEIRVIQWP